MRRIIKREDNHVVQLEIIIRVKKESPLQKRNNEQINRSRTCELTPNDKFVLRYLSELRKKSGRRGQTSPISIQKIAEACNVACRTVQNCADRLEAAGLIKRVGYNPTHKNIAKRGMIYEIKVTPKEIEHLIIPQID